MMAEKTHAQVREELTNHTNRRNMHSPFANTTTTQEALTADQQIRVAALNAAIRSLRKEAVLYPAKAICETTKDFEHYIKTGEVG